MQYGQGLHKVIVNGLNPSGLTMEDGHHFLQSSISNNKGFLLKLVTLGVHYDMLDIPSPIQDLLDDFSQVVLEPTGLPPSRGQDHHILLKTPNPISVRPYRYPYFQKLRLRK